MSDRDLDPTSPSRRAKFPRRRLRARLRWASAGVVFTVASLSAAKVRAEDPAPAPAAPPTAPAAAKNRAPTEKERVELLAALRAYLEADSPQGFNHRLTLTEVVKRLREAGCDVLSDVDGLRSLLYQARGFHPPYEKKPKDAGKDYEVRFDSASGILSVKADVRLSVSTPPAYLAARDQ